MLLPLRSSQKSKAFVNYYFRQCTGIGKRGKNMCLCQQEDYAAVKRISKQ